MIEEAAPVGWVISIRKMREVDQEQFGPWLDAAREWMASLPAPTEDKRLHFRHGEGKSSVIELEAIGWPTLTKPAIISGGPAYFDDSASRVRKVLIASQKRRQAHGATPPVLLAVDAPFDGPDAEDFDVTLFGSTVAHMDLDGRQYATTFESNGILVTDRSIPFDGVLGFFRLEYTGGRDPIVWVNPYSPHRLPEAITQLETRRWRAGIEIEPAKREDVISQIGFIRLDQ